MTFKIKTKKQKDLNLKKSGNYRTLYKIENDDGFVFWSLVSADKSMGEKDLKNKIYNVKKLKEGYNDGEYFSQGDIEAINEEKDEGL